MYKIKKKGPYTIIIYNNNSVSDWEFAIYLFNLNNIFKARQISVIATSITTNLSQTCNNRLINFDIFRQKRAIARIFFFNKAIKVPFSTKAVVSIKRSSYLFDPDCECKFYLTWDHDTKDKIEKTSSKTQRTWVKNSLKTTIKYTQTHANLKILNLQTHIKLIK